MNHETTRQQPFTLKPSVQTRLLGEFDALLEGLSHSDTSEGLKFKFRYLRDNLLMKYCDPDPRSGLDRRTAAISKWLDAERRNSRTNVRLYTDQTATFRTWRGHVESCEILRTARKTVTRLLGESPPEDVLYGTFSNGASTGFRRRPDSVAAKFKAGADITARCVSHFEALAERCEVWQMYRLGPLLWPKTIVSGGVLFTVPKNADIDRVAVKEPELNTFCQKGVGDYIRRRLRSVGINLNDQSRNQKLARKGSIDGTLATLDLSSASDLISIELVRKLLPTEWFYLLDDLRCHTAVVDGKEHHLEMFSSMGNGFTFELESLLFYALANSCAYWAGVRGQISVYGDDIIVPTRVAGLLVKVLAFCGFRVNTRKSFIRGPFRESCGKHWYRGLDVTPFYVREPVSSTDRLIHFLNRLRAWAVIASVPGMGGICHPAFADFFRRWMKRVPSRLYGGQDVNRIDALVTTHEPRMLLVKKRKSVKCDPLGAYLHWLRVTDGRSAVTDAMITSVVVAEVDEWVVRRNTQFGRLSIPEFPGEGTW